MHSQSENHCLLQDQRQVPICADVDSMVCFLDSTNAEKWIGSEKAQVPDQLHIVVLNRIHECRAALYVSKVNSCVGFEKNDSQFRVVVFCS